MMVMPANDHSGDVGDTEIVMTVSFLPVVQN